MLLERKVSPQPLVADQTKNLPVKELRTDLGIMRNWKIQRVERKAKADAVETLVRRTVETSLDINLAQIETDATILKTAVIARAVPLMGSLMQEATIRAGQVRLGLEHTEHQGIVHQIEFRHGAQAEMKRLRAQGLMTDDELAEVQAYIATMANKGITRFSHDIDRVHEALNAHLDRVADHIDSNKKD